ncbi:glutathione S-transferase [Marivivens sp. LCG002]|uniref:glutathione S-transferase n=1 Tax=Marivivens sp. LCG002 TaxID=3051171 RepID=UPI00255235A3|nr:glutathione S-transferase [Marivivens sp. LCG002]WIV50164.1 glutathione S-transferase [Marivivens sp. LCG002]
MSTPILYSFRRCPYAMRARLGIAASGQRVELREIVLRDKAPEFLAVSPSGTVPCLVNGAEVIDESLDVMTWALEQSDPEGWLDMPEEGWDWITRTDGSFKRALDRTKYETRYPECDPVEERAKAHAFLGELDTQIDGWIFGRPTLADFAILPFVRQFAFIDKALFDAEDWPNLKPWLERFLVSDRFAAIMTRHEKWQVDDAPIYFP